MPSRFHDERDLKILKMVNDGFSRTEIGNYFRLSRSAISGRVRRIQADDLEFSGEKPEMVSRFYKYLG